MNPSPAPVSTISPHVASYVQEVVMKALQSTAEQRNFAQEGNGAKIISQLTSPLTLDTRGHPELVLVESYGNDSCFSLVGDRGQIAIRLHTLAYPTRVTIDYAPSSMEGWMEAPRRMLLWGLVDGTTNLATYNDQLRLYRSETPAKNYISPPLHLGRTYLLLAEFEFNINFPIQTFPLADEVVLSHMWFGVLVLEIRSNWGANMTSICRVRVHGEEKHDKKKW